MPVRPGVGPFGELLPPVLAERIDAQWRERDGACGVLGFGPDEAQCPADSLKRLDHFERACVEIGVLPAQAEQLATAQAEAER
jgi:hypothetical protein